jgi:hypothetical protein
VDNKMYVSAKYAALISTCIVQEVGKIPSIEEVVQPLKLPSLILLPLVDDKIARYVLTPV